MKRKSQPPQPRAWVQASGISQEWDLMWDIKTPDAARREFQRLQEELRTIPAQLERMKELARQDGFKIS